MNLEHIIQGRETTLLERASTKAILSDALENNTPKINAMMSAYEVGIVKILEDNYPLSALMRTTLINKLTSQYSMQEAVASWAVDQWKTIMTPSVIKGLIAAREEKEAERQKKINQLGELPAPIEIEPPMPAVPDFDSQPDLTTKADIADYYTNVKLSKVEGKIFVPCGVGTTDNGFYICGIKEDPVSSAPAVFALVYNYLTRNSTILPEDYPHYLKRISTSSITNEFTG